MIYFIDFITFDIVIRRAKALGFDWVPFHSIDFGRSHGGDTKRRSCGGCDM